MIDTQGEYRELSSASFGAEIWDIALLVCFSNRRWGKFGTLATELWTLIWA